ncbi:hypothetical protein BSKO_10726 [Bryopsis sp. KO-2023]|nr:hypothetical protein BSKO_10726 [Bryopsis sp. KO-2023]
MSDWEKQKRVILPYLQRAEEIDKVDDKVAYYSRLYAVDQGINLENRHPKADELLSVVLTQLEKHKPSSELNQDEDKKHCERFALKVFRKAQKKDVQGVVDRDTAKAYYAAFNFLEILKQFGDLAAEVERLRRFAVYRASEIKKAIDEGKEPPPIGMQQEENEMASSQPLIEFDPGYQVGLRVLCTEDGVTPGVSAIVQAVSGEVGGCFDVELLPSGKVLEMSTTFLAPELPKGSRVTYYSPEGLQFEGEVTEMNKEAWPPVYTLQLENGTVATTKHSNFTLTYVPIVCNTSGSWLVRTESHAKGRTASQETNNSAPAPPQPFPGLAEADSFIVPPSLEPAGTDDFKALLPHPDAIPPEPVNGGDHHTMDVTYPTESADARPHQNGNYDRVDVLAGLTSSGQQPHESQFAPPPPAPVDSQPPPQFPNVVPSQPPVQYPAQYPVTMVVPQESAPQPAQPPPLMLKRPPNFEPDLQAIEDAKRCAKYANTSLNFSDVDNAIVYLTDALKILTGQTDR